jgi:Arc/MetJ-type ribon-helix-helix transcriptional regulator
MSDLVRTQILLDKNQRLELDEIADREGKSFSEVVRSLLAAQLHQRKYEEMRLAAEQLAADYGQDGELSDLTALDGEDFLNA